MKIPTVVKNFLGKYIHVGHGDALDVTDEQDSALWAALLNNESAVAVYLLDDFLRDVKLEDEDDYF